jgi:uncharacterized protein (DUF4415 family)
MTERDKDDVSGLEGWKDMSDDHKALFEKSTEQAKNVRGPQKAPVKKAVSLRLDQDVVDHFKALGKGYQSKINDILREFAGLDHKS